MTPGMCCCLKHGARALSPRPPHRRWFVQTALLQPGLCHPQPAACFQTLKQMAPSLPVQGYRQLYCPSKRNPKLQAGQPFCSLHPPISLLRCSTSPVTSHHPILSSEQLQPSGARGY